MFFRIFTLFSFCSVLLGSIGVYQASAVENEHIHVSFLTTVDENGNSPNESNTLLFEGVEGNPILAPDAHQLTLDEYITPHGTVTVECPGDGTHVTFELAGLIPNGVYTIWVDFYNPPGFTPDFAHEIAFGALGPNDGSESVFTVSASGEGKLDAIIAPGELSIFGEVGDCGLDIFEFHLFGVYHIDGKTYGPLPGTDPDGFPDGTWVDHFGFIFQEGMPFVLQTTVVQPQDKLATLWAGIKQSR